MKFIIALLSLLAFPIAALATSPVAGIDPLPPVDPPQPFGELGTVTGVVGATLVVVEAVKRLFATTPFIQKAPVWTIAIAVSAILTVLANQLFKSLEGDLPALIWQAALAAASASGFYTWLRKPGEGSEAATAL